MKSFLNLLFLSPILLYVILLLLNLDLLKKEETINLFWLWEVEIPLFAIISVFFIIYIFLLYFSGKFVSFFTAHRIKKLEEENLKLKADIADLIPEITKTIDEKILKMTDEIKNLADKSLELHKKETSKVLGNLEFEINDLKTKIKTKNINE